MEIFLYLLCFLFCLSIVSLVVLIYNAIKKQQLQQQQAVAEQQRIALQRKQAAELESNEILNLREKKYGKLTKSISLSSNQRVGDIAIYGDAKVICIQKQAYAFRDIISCDLNVKTTTVAGKETQIYTTPSDWDKKKYKADHWLSGKQLVGQTIIQRQPDVQHQQCTLYISVNDLVQPMITLECGENIAKANEIKATLQVIINQNKA